MPDQRVLSGRSILLEIGAALAVVALLVSFLVQQYRSQLSLITEQQMMALDVAYRATLEAYRLDVTTRFRLQVMRPEVLDLMAEALDTPEERMPLLRGRLYRLLKPVYDELQQEGLAQFQFHLADDRSLLRFHMPGKAGDPLFSLRPSIRIANTEKRMVTGLEIGRTLPAFRHVFPVARNGRHLGSVELSLPFDRLQDNMNRLLKSGEFGLFLDKTVVYSKVDSGNREKFAEAQLHPDFLVENPTISRVARRMMQSDKVLRLQRLLREDAAAQAQMRARDSFVVALEDDGNDYLVTLMGVTDLTGQWVAYVARFTRNEALGEMRDSLIWQGMLAVLLIVALTMVVHRMRLQRAELRDDIRQREIAEQGLRLYESVFRHSGEAIIVTDHGNSIIAANPAFTLLTGYTFDEVRGRNPNMLSSGQTPVETFQTLWACLHASGYWQGELTDRRKSGEIYPKWATISVIRDAQGGITHHIASFTDITERKAAEARIEKLAHYDVLTGLLNRYSLESRLEQSLLAARREEHRLALMFIDLDRFKSINDTLGHHVGDLLLQEVARRLQSGVRESDIVARQGGDEFVVVLTGLVENHDAAPVANKLLRLLGDCYQLGGHDLRSSPSIGIAMFPDDGDNAEDLLKNADTAMYHAKEKGRNNIQFFTTAMTVAASESLAIERDLYVAMAERQLVLYYQPKVRAGDRSLCGVEALIRWHHPERGLIPPDRFIPIAEDAGIINAIGAWVIEEACRQWSQWSKTGIPLQMAVNLSAHQLRSPHLTVWIEECLSRYGVPPDALELEITESVAMENPERAIDQLGSLRKLGVTLAIDDFGTGYSSLAYLKHLPIQTLKLDRSFVRDIEVDANDAAISAATIALAHTLGLKVVAEGVETEAQARFLGETHACDILQGYLFGRPEPAAVLTSRLMSFPLNLSTADTMA